MVMKLKKKQEHYKKICKVEMQDEKLVSKQNLNRSQKTFISLVQCKTFVTNIFADFDILHYWHVFSRHLGYLLINIQPLISTAFLIFSKQNSLKLIGMSMKECRIG